MVPPLQQAGLYKGLRRLKDSLDNYHNRPDAELLTDIRTQADKLGIVVNGVYAQANGLANGANGHTNGSANGHTNGANGHLSDDAYVRALGHELIQVEHRMIPLGLHVLGRAPVEAELIDMLPWWSPSTRPNIPSGTKSCLPCRCSLPAAWAGTLSSSSSRSRLISNPRSVGTESKT